MPLHIKDHPWIKIDHINGMLTCTKCGEHEKISPITGLEGVVDTVRPFARAHAHKATRQAEPDGGTDQASGKTRE